MASGIAVARAKAGLPKADWEAAMHVYICLTDEFCQSPFTPFKDRSISPLFKGEKDIDNAGDSRQRQQHSSASSLL